MMRINPVDVALYNTGLTEDRHTGYFAFIDIETHKHIIDIYTEGEHTKSYEFETKDEWLSKIDELKELSNKGCETQ